METIRNIKEFMGTNSDGWEINIHDCEQIGSISQDTYQYDNYGITLYRTDKGIVMYEDQSNDSEFYLLSNEESKDAQENPEDFLKYHAELWAENTGDYDQQRLEMIAWGLRESSDYEVSEDYKGECKIIVEECYYGPYRPLSYLSDDPYGKTTIFKNKESAQERINKLEDGVYSLSNNEAGSPSYTIVKA